MTKIAFFTFGVLREPEDHPRSRDFVDRGDPTFEAAEASEGFVDRSVFDEETGLQSWGDSVPPRFTSNDEPWESTLSRWENLESVFAFAYSGFHSENLRRRREWFVTPQWPSYVTWWVADDHTPDWHEAKDRLERLHDEGSSPYAFDFKHPFDAHGGPIELDRKLVQEKIDRNVA